MGFLVGLPALRLDGLYLALTTFALAVAIPQILKYKLFEDWTGGVQGLVIDKPDAPFGLPLSPDQWLYLFTLVVAVVLYVIAWNIVRGRIGRAMMAIRDHAMAAEAMGINLPMVKTRTFALSAMFTGLAGSLGAIAVQFVAPDSFGVFVSIFLFVGLVVGGVSSIGGTLIGAAFIEFVPNLADKVSKAAPGAVYGVILIAVMFLMPAGAGGFLYAMARRLFRSRVGGPRASHRGAGRWRSTLYPCEAAIRADRHEDRAAPFRGAASSRPGNYRARATEADALSLSRDAIQNAFARTGRPPGRRRRRCGQPNRPAPASA